MLSSSIKSVTTLNLKQSFAYDINLTEQKNRKAGDSPVGVFEILWQGLFSRSPKPIV